VAGPEEGVTVSSVISNDGTVIDYERYGEGPTVVLVGGATQYRGVDERTTRVARLLGERGYGAVDYDRRGRGKSGDTAPWALEREVEDLAAIVGAVGGPAVLYSSSSGATVALAAAAGGLDVVGLALYEPPFFAGVDHKDKLDRLRELLAAGDNDGALRYNMTSVIGVPAAVVDGMAGSPGWPGLVAVAPTLPYDLDAVEAVNQDPDWVARWRGVTVPAVVYSGDRTFPGMPEAADAVAAALPNARRQVLPGQDHGPAPEAIVPVLVDFLREVAP
jgi:pimeloyl-ACP methyl ester carboxylesterase